MWVNLQYFCFMRVYLRSGNYRVFVIPASVCQCYDHGCGKYVLEYIVKIQVLLFVWMKRCSMWLTKFVRKLLHSLHNVMVYWEALSLYSSERKSTTRLYPKVWSTTHTPSVELFNFMLYITMYSVYIYSSNALNIMSATITSICHAQGVL